HPPRSTRYPYTTLFRSRHDRVERQRDRPEHPLFQLLVSLVALVRAVGVELDGNELRERRRHVRVPKDLILHQAAVRAGEACEVRSEEHTSELQSPDHLV